MSPVSCTPQGLFSHVFFNHFRNIKNYYLTKTQRSLYMLLSPHTLIYATASSIQNSIDWLQTFPVCFRTHLKLLFITFKALRGFALCLYFVPLSTTSLYVAWALQANVFCLFQSHDLNPEGTLFTVRALRLWNNPPKGISHSIFEISSWKILLSKSLSWF